VRFQLSFFLKPEKTKSTPVQSNLEKLTGASLALIQFGYNGRVKMKKNIFLQIAAIVIMGFLFMLVLKSDHTWAQTQLRQSVERKFEEYRTAIKDSYQVDIKNFKDKIPGGLADGKAITDYDLKELLEGIKWEREHTNDSLLALEMAMDHLERIPDYYTHLVIMERGCAEEKFRKM
jgi:hypothetical protein